MPDGLDAIFQAYDNPGAAAPAAPAAPVTPPVTETTPVTPPPAVENPTDGTPAVPATPATPPATPPAAPEQTPEQIFAGSKQNQAFAQMRTQNTQYLKTISKLGQLLGVTDMSNPDLIVQTVEQKLMEFEAQTNNVPVEIYKRLEEAERLRQESESGILSTNATLGFQKVKDTYKLDQPQLQAFAEQLSAAGKNPYQQNIDLMQEYRNMNFEKIVAAEKDAAVKEAIARQNKANTQSSTPSSAQGKPSDTGPATINSVADLTKFLDTMGKA